MPAIELTPAQRKDHRAAAHHLSPVAMVGGDGLTPAVIKEIDLALNAHGLIKVRVFSDDRPTREAMFSQLSDELGAAGSCVMRVTSAPPERAIPPFIPSRARTSRHAHAITTYSTNITRNACSANSAPSGPSDFTSTVPSSARV